MDVVETTTAAEVNQLTGVLGSDDDVGRLQVEVDDAISVDEIDGTRYIQAISAEHSHTYLLNQLISTICNALI